MIIGITGGVGSGKSAVLQILKNKFHAEVIEADIIAHEIMEPGNLCYTQILSGFGTEILDEQQKINRNKLGDITFNNKEKLDSLCRVIHPAVWDEINKKIKTIQTHKPDSIIVIEAALLIEGGYKSLCDEIWYVYTDMQIRQKRLKENRGYSDKKIQDIMSNQLSDKAFRENSDYIIDNSKTLKDTETQIQKKLEF